MRSAKAAMIYHARFCVVAHVAAAEIELAVSGIHTLRKPRHHVFQRIIAGNELPQRSLREAMLGKQASEESLMRSAVEITPRRSGMPPSSIQNCSPLDPADPSRKSMAQVIVGQCFELLFAAQQ